jgi:predicted ATPase/class 3 adenylate cyclase
MTDQEQIEAGIAALEAQRALLGDAVVDMALGPLKAKLAALAAQPVDPAPEQQLKQATVLFTDVVGSTTLSQHLDPEDIHLIMDGALERFTAIVSAHRGRVLQYAGDSVLAVFGADGAHEDDAERAIHAGLAVLAEARIVAAEVQRQYGHEGFNVRVGISTGAVLLGGGVDEENSVRGITVNTAARMEQTAPAGGLRISHDTYRHVRGVFDVAEQPPLLVKGRDEPLVTYLVQRAKPRAFRVTTRGIEGIATRMVGRDAELEQLQDAFRALYRERRLIALAVVAEAGLGKSRLLYEFENWAEAQSQPFFVFRGRAHPLTAQQPFGLLREVLAWRMQIADSDDADTARNKLVAGIAPLLGADGEALAHVLGHVVGLDFSTSPHVRDLLDDAKQLRNRAFHAAALTLRRMTERDGHPAMLVLDDLHWADEGSLDFISYLLQVNRDVPMLLICLARPSLFERRSSWASVESAYTRIDLEPLDKRASRELTLELLQRLDTVPAALRDLVTSGAEGNPFYMEELVKMLVDEGAIVTGSERWTVVPDKLVTTHVPPTLTGVLQARLDSLPPAEKKALQEASVVGFVFWDKALAALDKRSVEVLGSIVKRELVHPSETDTFDGLREFVFRHQVLHQVAYDSVLKRQRREYHALVAAWLAELGGARAGEILGLTAEHFERAGDDTRACEFFCRAAEYAAARFANAEMMTHVARALALAAADDAATRWRLLVVRESYLRYKDEQAAHASDLGALQSLADALGDDARRAEVAFRRASTYIVRGEHVEVEAEARLAIALADGAGEHALAAQAACALAEALIRQGLYDMAEEVVDKHLPLARNRSDTKNETLLLSIVGLIAMERGDLMRAAQSFEQSLAMDRVSGNLSRQSVELNNLGAIYSLLGNYERARAHLDDGLRVARDAGRRDAEASVLVNLASVTNLQGDDSSTLAYANTAHEVATGCGQRDLVAYARLVGGHAELALGRHEQAAEAYRQSRDQLLELQMRRQQVLDPVAGLARVALAQGDLPAALEQVELILAHIAAGGTFDGTEEPLRLPLTCFQVLRAAGDPRAAEVLASAHAELQKQAERISDPAARRSFLQNVPHNREIMAAWARRGGEVSRAG